MRLIHNPLRLDETGADRILDGVVPAEDAAPGYAAAVRLLDEAARGASETRRSSVSDESASDRQAATIAAMQAAVLGRVVPVTNTRRNEMRSKVVAPRALAMAAAAVLGVGTGAAALTGALLPSNASQKAVDATSGLSTPASADNNVDNSSPPSLPGTGPGHATFGLCTALLAGDDNGSTTTTNPGKDSSTAFEALIAAHGGTVASAITFCQTYVAAHHPGKSNNDVGDGPKNSSGTGTGDDNTSSSSSDSNVSTPNSGGTGTSDGASEGASDSGTSTANSSSDGVSQSGSSNATSHSSH